MLISLPEIIKKYSLNIKGVIQVGCHWCEEHEIFVGLGIKDIVYIEPCKEAFTIMSKKVLKENMAGSLIPNYLVQLYDDNIKCFCCACGDEFGSAKMNVSHNNQGQSNSLLKPMLHLYQHPEVVFTDIEDVVVIPLDDLPFEKKGYNLLVMDCQGSEGLVLKGATETLKHIDCIYTEVNRDMTYEGNMLIEEMDEFLRPFGFVRMETFWPSPNWSWGDCVFLKGITDRLIPLPQ